MDLIQVKLLVLGLSGVVRTFFGLFPLLVLKALSKKWSKATDKKIKKAISILMFFGGGVLLATCFLHMMPEVRESFAEAEPTLSFPFTEVIFLGGFFLVYLIEDIVHSIVYNRKHHQHHESRSRQVNETSQKGNHKQNLSLSSVTVKGDKNKALHNGEPVDAGKPFSVSSIGSIQPEYSPRGKRSTSSITAINITNAKSGVAVNGNGNHQVGSGRGNACLHKEALSLSKSEDENCINPNNLRGTREIFRKNPSAIPDEIPGLSRSRAQNGMGGITNGAFVSVEKFQYCDPDWMKDIVNTNSQINLLTGSNCTVASCTTITTNATTPGSPTASLDDEGNGNRNPCTRNAHLHPSHNGHEGVILKKETTTACTTNASRCDSSHSDQKNKSLHHRRHNHHHRHPKNNTNHSHGHSHVQLPMDEDDTIGGEIRNILIVVAISFHGIFEGMAIGLQSSVQDVWYLFLAVSLHECTILFCIGVELISSKTKVLRMVLYILVVALVSPVGIAIGIVVTEKSLSIGLHRALVVGCFQGLAAGTLLYVTFFEIFQEEGKKLHRKCYHILVAVLGFVLMGSIEFMGGHEHGGHSHSHGSSSNDSLVTLEADHADHSHSNKVGSHQLGNNSSEPTHDHHH